MKFLSFLASTSFKNKEKNGQQSITKTKRKMKQRLARVSGLSFGQQMNHMLIFRSADLVMKL